jgi:hypothetical protein
MTLPADQRLLYDDLCAKLDQQQAEPQLIAFMGGVLGSLLRRRGDAAFLRAVQDAFTAGLAGRPWPAQVELAREVIGMVIAKRPEVALAWQRVSGEEPHPLARRAVDVPPPGDELPEISLDFDENDLPPSEPGDVLAAFEAALTNDLGGALERRLALFAVPPLRFPSPAYTHEQPFFMAADGFGALARDFLGGRVLPLCREEVGALVARHGGGDAAALLTDLRAEVWQLLLGRLSVAAELAESARAKLAAAQAGDAAAPEYRLVKVPVSRKKVFSVLGVKFAMGTSVEMTTRKVKVTDTGRPGADEMRALELATAWHDMAAGAGFDLPDAAGLGVLHALLSFDAERLARDLPDLLALARDVDADAEALFDGIDAVTAGHPDAIADAVAVTLFAHGFDGGFGYEELVRLGNRWGGERHPLLVREIMRRPRDLAFQLRDALRQRIDRNNLGLSVVMLCEVWKVLNGTPHAQALEMASTVFAAFPIAFAGDADEATFSEIGAAMAKGFAAPTLDAATLIETATRLYGKVVAATKQRV